MMKLSALAVSALLVGACAAHAGTVVVTASNAANNQLLVYDTAANLVQTVSTGGQGGVSGNAGGIAAQGNRVAVVNFGSQSVSMFEREDGRFRVTQQIPAASKPVSVAFGHGHLYVLGTTTVESHQVFGFGIDPSADGVVPLLKADGSAAQVGVVRKQLVISEKSNVIETVDLLNDGAVNGVAALVSNIPANVNAPFGLVTRGNDAYVTIAHADEISLVRNGAVLTVTGSGTQHAPCWLTLVGPFLYSSNSPSMSVSRYVVFGRSIIQQDAVAAHFNGAPTDIDSGDGLVAVIDGSGSVSHLSVFEVDDDGNLALKAATTINALVNGIAVVPGD